MALRNIGEKSLILDRYSEFVQIYGNNFRVLPSVVQDDLFEKYRVGFGAEFFIGRRVVLVYGMARTGEGGGNGGRKDLYDFDSRR